MRRRPFPTVLVGPRTLILEGITRILTPTCFRVIASASSIDDLSPELLPEGELLLLIVDAGDNPVASIEQIKLFKERYPTGRIAVLADRCQSNEVMCAYRAGANAYLVEVSASNVLIKSLELVMLGETIVPPAILSSVSAGDDRCEPGVYADVSSRETNAADELISGESVLVPKLSAREKCILRCLLDGDANKVIARKVDIAEATVKVHVKAILRKIRVQNRTQAAIWAMNCRLFAAEMEDGSAASRPNRLGRGLLNGNHSGPARNAAQQMPHRRP
jgi:two-component system, NarL family, nitrate/nitrite response regulator NarL